MVDGDVQSLTGAKNGFDRLKCLVIVSVALSNDESIPNESIDEFRLLGWLTFCFSPLQPRTFFNTPQHPHIHAHQHTFLF